MSGPLHSAQSCRRRLRCLRAEWGLHRFRASSDAIVPDVPVDRRVDSTGMDEDRPQGGLSSCRRWRTVWEGLQGRPLSVWQTWAPYPRLEGAERRGAACWVRAPSASGSYLVDPASSHMLVSKTKPCMSKYKCFYTVKLRMAH